MKITVFNGSPKGEAGNTNFMVTAFLEGARAAGAEAENIFLVNKEINHCQACSSCIISGQGKCVLQDDMGELVTKFLQTDIAVFATPMYIENVSGRLKVFMDRLFCIGNPKYKTDEEGEYRFEKSKWFKDGVPPKIVVISNGGYADRRNFQVISLLMKRYTWHFHMELIGEIYAAQALVLGSVRYGVKEFEPLINDYTKLLSQAGREIASDLKLSEETQRLLDKEFISPERYVQIMNRLAETGTLE